ncbi:MAG: SBBP repeat-containing protein, partial [Acidobacteriota bacterium]
MKSMLSSAALSLALVAACGVSHPTTDNGQSNGTVNGGSTQTGGGTAASCPLGEATLNVNLGAASATSLLDLAIDANANVFVAGDFGLQAFSAMGSALFSLPAGTLVRTDAQGNIYVVGSFTSRIDLGAGVMVPNGNIDVFVAKLDVKGKILFVKQLGLCGDGVMSLAIAANGRIAISGTAMGTVVLSASGDVLFSLQQSGFVAFDSKGNVYIASTLAAGVEIGASVAQMGDTLRIMKVDLSGNVVFSQTFQGTARFNGIAIDASDHIQLIGETRGTIDFFGTSVTARTAGESGFVSGAFLVELDTTCSLVLVRDLGMVEANGIAIDLDGNIFIAGATTVNTGFFRAIAVMKIDVRGVMSNVDLGLAAQNGRALALAVDACGAVYVAVVQQASPSAMSAISAV